MKRLNLNNLLLFCGSSLLLTAGLLTAYTPGLAYVTVQSYHGDVPNPPFGLPNVMYQSLDFTAHIFTVRFLLSAVGGLIGIFALLGKSKRACIGGIAVTVAGLGLIFTPISDMRLTFPEARLFDVPWTGAFIAVVGICLMFLGLTIRKEHVPKASFLSVPLLLAVYSVLPIFIICNYLPWIVFGPARFNPVEVLLWFMAFASLLLMTRVTLGSNIRLFVKKHLT